MLGFSLLLPWRAKIDVFAFLFAGMVLSLYIAWFVFVVSFHTPLGVLMPWLAPVAAIAALGALIWRARSLPLAIPAFSDWRQNLVFTGVVAAAGVLLSMQASQAIGQIFELWDSVVSWNRWAAELSRNEYQPYPAAYPILWPGMWSLIYEAQGHAEIWYLPRASLAILAFGALALLVHTGLKRGILAFLLLFIPVYFAFFSKVALYSGYMDQPSALLGLAALLVTFLALGETDIERRNNALLIAVVTASLAIMTKQHGIFAAASVCAVIAVLALARRMSFARASVLAAVFLAPVATFLFIYLGQQDALWGNFSNLDDVTARAAAGRSRLEMAVDRMGAELPLAVWIMLAIGVLANAVAWRDPRAWFSALLVALTLPGFLLYAECCSYSERNGMWIFSHLIASSFIGYSLALDRFASRWKPLVWLSQGADDSRRLTAGAPSMAVASGVLGTCVIALVLIWPQERLLEVHHEQQRELEPRARALFERQGGGSELYDQIISSISIIYYNPDLGSKVRGCLPVTPACFHDISPGRTAFITANWFENEAATRLIEAMVESGSLILLDRERGVRLYRVDGPPPAVIPEPVAFVPLRLHDPRDQISATFTPARWRTVGGGRATLPVSLAGLELVENNHALSVDALPAEPGVRYRMVFEGVVLHPGTADRPANVLAGPVAVSADNQFVAHWASAGLEAAVARVREGGDGRFTAERIMRAPEGAHSIHMAFGGPWRADGVFGGSRTRITSARLERLDD